MRTKLISFCFSFISVTAGCQPSKEIAIDSINRCYDQILENLKHEPLYDSVMHEFSDTFPEWKNTSNYFGNMSFHISYPDEALFFNKKHDKCLLIVPIRENEFRGLFGTARIVKGYKKNSSWQFKGSVKYSYANDYFESNPNNSLDTIARLARYSVIIAGRPRSLGVCSIVENYWFVEFEK